MSEQVQLRRGTTAQNATFTGAQGELTVDTSLTKLILHDGATVGGHLIASEAYVAAQLVNVGFIAVPTASIGKVGDHAGLVAIDVTYLYYCIGNYDGITPIWKRQALTGATW